MLTAASKYPDIPAVYTSSLKLKRLELESSIITLRTAVSTGKGKANKLMAECKSAMDALTVMVKRVEGQITELQEMGVEPAESKSSEGGAKPDEGRGA
jgi:hypothetical protein